MCRTTQTKVWWPSESLSPNLRMISSLLGTTSPSEMTLPRCRMVAPITTPSKAPRSTKLIPPYMSSWTTPIANLEIATRPQVLRAMETILQFTGTARFTWPPKVMRQMAIPKWRAQASSLATTSLLTSQTPHTSRTTRPSRSLSPTVVPPLWPHLQLFSPPLSPSLSDYHDQRRDKLQQ